MKDLLTEDDLVSLHFQEHGIGGYSRLIPPQEDGAAIVELRATPGEDEWTISLLQGTPGEPSIREDHVVLTSLPRALSKERFMKLLEVFGVMP